MNILCFDISTGGLTAAVFNEDLHASKVREFPWKIVLQPDGSATLDVSVFNHAFAALAQTMSGEFPSTIDAVAFSAFMHSCVLLGSSGDLRSSIYTWLDRRGRSGVERMRKVFGARFHGITGCRYHPMFPVFKLASFDLPAEGKVASAKSLALARLTGGWFEDRGTASASGLYDVVRDDWSEEILEIVHLKPNALPQLVEREAIVGSVTRQAAADFGLKSGIPIVAGSGDGFLANVGSGCNDAKQIAITLGTSASARQVVSHPILNENAGTFCYRAQPGSYLLGCASSNGGNVLDWAQSVFGLPVDQPAAGRDLPTFIPLLNGERSPEWNEALTASWHDIRSSHTAADLATAVVEGVVFNLAHYVDILQRESGIRAEEVILSGNGFLNPVALQTLASTLELRVLQPKDQGLASLRGAAICGLKALGIQPEPAIERLVVDARWITAGPDPIPVRQRYRRYRELRELRES